MISVWLDPCPRAASEKEVGTLKESEMRCYASTCPQSTLNRTSESKSIRRSSNPRTRSRREACPVMSAPGGTELQKYVSSKINMIQQLISGAWPAPFLSCSKHTSITSANRKATRALLRRKPSTSSPETHATLFPGDLRTELTLSM